MICSYCQTETENTETCDFCKADLTAARPEVNPDLSELDVNRTQPELMRLHTFDLMRLLRHIRDERSKSYRIMQLVRKTPDEAKKEELNEFGQQFYRDLTAKQNVIEQILVDRMGYYPQRVDGKLLSALTNKIERCVQNEQKTRRGQASK